MSKDWVKYLQDHEARGSVLIEDAAGAMQPFRQVLNHASKAGALDAKVKELMVLAISIAIGCEGCIAFHARAAVRKGATREQVLETIAVAIGMGGGPSTIYGAEVLEAYDQFAAEQAR
jgi:AhpD family alkylhydroperoxidase